MALFLTGRFVGYMAFALAVWGLGVVLPLGPRPRVELFAWAHLAVAVAMVVWVVRLPRRRPSDGALPPPPDQGGDTRRHLAIAPPPPWPVLTLGLLTGLNLCPPFVAASLRALQAGSLPRCLAFFALFFAGTVVWFFPVLAITNLSRHEGAPLVARVGAGLVAVYYVWLAVPPLLGEWLHG